MARTSGLLPAALLAATALTSPAEAGPLTWETVVNNSFTAPSSDRLFNSYSGASVNNAGVVVFRARTRAGFRPPGTGEGEETITPADAGGGGGHGGGGHGGGHGGGGVTGEPISGVFRRDMGVPAAPIEAIAVRNQTVPAPNNTGAQFNEFPSFPRIDAGSSLAATRGQSQPVWKVIDPDTGETLTRLGTAGI